MRCHTFFEIQKIVSIFIKIPIFLQDYVVPLYDFFKITKNITKMKTRKILILTMALVLGSVFMTLFACCESEKVVKYDELPQQSKTFLETHFESITVSSVVKEKDDFTITWNVYLANGWEIDFRKNGDWNDIDCKYSPVPASVLGLLPASIASYCAANFPAASIVEINREKYGYEIGLSNDLELKFNGQGGFLKID